MGLTVTARNAMLDSQTFDRMSLHSGDPSTTGANELAGGSPAYARKSCVFNSAVTGARAQNADVVFDVPAGSTVSYIGLWDNNGGSMVFKGSFDATNEVYAGQGTYTAAAASGSISLS